MPKKNELADAIGEYAEKNYWNKPSTLIGASEFKNIAEGAKTLETAVKNSKEGKSKILVKLGIGSKSLKAVKNIRKDLDNAHKLAEKIQKKIQKLFPGTKGEVFNCFITEELRDKLEGYIESARKKVNALANASGDDLKKFLKSGKKKGEVTGDENYARVVMEGTKEQWKTLENKMKEFELSVGSMKLDTDE